MKTFWRTWTTVGVLVIFSSVSAFAQQQGLTIREVRFETFESLANMTIEMDLGLNQSLRTALEGGIEIGFVAELKIMRDGWLFNRELEMFTWMTRIRRLSFGQGYEYRLFNSNIWLETDSVEEALTQMGQLILLFEDPLLLRTVKRPDVYFNHRVEVDLSSLSNPLQVDLLTSNDWLFSSGWQHSQR